MSRTVLFAGGPLHGQALVTDSAMGVYAMPDYPVSVAGGPPDRGWPPEPVLYRIARFAICGRIVWIGYLGAEPDDDLVFEVLTSDGAKQASNVQEVSAHP